MTKLFEKQLEMKRGIRVARSVALRIHGCAMVLAMVVGFAATSKAGEAVVTNSSAAGTNKPALSPEDFVTDKVIAKGKGFELKRSQLERAFINAKAFYAGQGQRVTATQLQELEVRELNALLTVRLLYLKATAEQKARGQEEGEKAYEARRKSAPSEEFFIRALEDQGLKPDTYRTAIIEESVGHQVMLSRVKVTDEQIKKFYDENPAAADVPEQARINFIMLARTDPRAGTAPTEEQRKAKRKELEDVRERAAKGEDFTKLAVSYSEDPQAKQTGGEYIVVRGSRRVPPEFEVAAFALQTNEMSQVISVDDGLFLIKLKEKFPARKYSLAEASPMIKQFLERQEIEKAIPRVYAELKKEFAVEIVDERLNTLDQVFSKPLPSPGTPDKQE